MTQVRILRGTYHDKPVSGVFKAVKEYRVGARGGFITVENNGHPSLAGGGDRCRIRLDSENDLDFTGGDTVISSAVRASGVMAFTPVATIPAIPTESDEDAMNRIAGRFAVLDKMAKACIKGDIRAMIVTGPPGVGKSHGVTVQMEKASLFDQLSGNRSRYQIVKGAMSAIGLFALLYKFSDSGNVLVFDDCDIWEDQDAVNILKGALDSGKTRRISYNKDSRLLREEGIPNTFDFQGSIIFITNANFEGKKASKIEPHLKALRSRCHFLDLTINTIRDKMLRVRQVHRDADPGLFVDYNFTAEQEAEILTFMWDNRERLDEISMRMALKIADLIHMDADDWRTLAAATCMR